MQTGFTLNGTPHTADAPAETLLADYLRDELGLTGTHIGCDTSQCGACVVHLDGKAVKSCTTLAVMADGHEVKTIEGLAADGAPLHPMQEAFREHHGLQCGFCTPGMIMTAVDLVHRKGHDLSDEVIREELEGNLCRCTGYQNIVEAIRIGAREISRGAGCDGDLPAGGRGGGGGGLVAAFATARPELGHQLTTSAVVAVPFSGVRSVVAESSSG